MPGIRDIEDRLASIGYSKRQSKSTAAKLSRSLEFAEVSALFRMDPTGLVAALRSLGYDVPERYAATRPRTQAVAS